MSEPMTRAPGTIALSCHKNPPGPHSHFLLGSAPDVQSDPLRFLSTLAHQYGDIVRFRFVFWPTCLVSHPEGVKHVLQENHRNYNKGLYSYRTLKPFVGNGLFTNDGEFWMQQRRLIQPAFHRQRLVDFGTLMTDTTIALLAQWQSFDASDRPLDIAAEMMRLTLCIVSRALFNIDLNNEVDTIGQAVMTVNKLLCEYLYVPFPPLNVPTPRNRRFHTALRALDRVVQDIITAHRRQNRDTGDLLSMLLLAHDEETGQGMSDKQVRDEVMTLLVAGHETTANALTWAWYLLSRHPEAEARLQAELNEVLGGHLPTVNHLAKLPYTRMVIEEALRLYPPAWSFSHLMGLPSTGQWLRW